MLRVHWCWKQSGLWRVLTGQKPCSQGWGRQARLGSTPRSSLPTENYYECWTNIKTNSYKHWKQQQTNWRGTCTWRHWGTLFFRCCACRQVPSCDSHNHAATPQTAHLWPNFPEQPVKGSGQPQPESERRKPRKEKAIQGPKKKSRTNSPTSVQTTHRQESWAHTAWLLPTGPHTRIPGE